MTNGSLLTSRLNRVYHSTEGTKALVYGKIDALSRVVMINNETSEKKKVNVVVSQH